MDRQELEKFITETYSVTAECPWAQYPGYMVFRHSGNRKWFAVIMDILPQKLGLPAGGTMDIVNVKCDPVMLGSFRAEPGVYPGYHLNKAHWLSVALDGSADAEKVKLLVDISFALTAPKTKKRKPQQKNQRKP